jgi:eukaryotic-like serine/threonine-protein kinase
VPILPGTRLGGYEIRDVIGVGGMGEVYRARHVKLERDVAIKVLPDDVAADRSRLARFEREARTASALNHPGIVTIHDIGESDGITFIAMELVEGRTLRQLITDAPLPVDRALDFAVQIADALARAHQSGIVHRDIKPANIMVTPAGLVKILDFGLARGAPSAGARPSVESGPSTATDQPEDSAEPAPAGQPPTSHLPTVTDTVDGMIVGTPHYMSPEQLSGRAVDQRTDQFAFGVVLYEMLGGRRPFDGPSLTAVISAILVEQPAPIRRLRPAVPSNVERVIARCLEKDAAARYATSATLLAALRDCVERRTRARYGALSQLRRPAIATPLAVALLAIVLSAGWWARGADARWAERDALDEITRFADAGELYEAFRTARTALRHRPGDPELVRVLERITLPVMVNTDPAGAEVFVKGYNSPDAPWDRLGETPLETRIPYALMRWRITKEGHEPFEGAPFSGAAIAVLAQGVTLDPVGSRPAGTVRVPGGMLERVPLIRPAEFMTGAQLGDQFMDRFEVTNRAYLEFVHAGGYASPEWWPSPKRRAGRDVAWQDAVDSFRDRTGRPGPSTWELGGYPAGEDEIPVSGVSWFEAAAYCAFTGRSLPTVYHWFRAIGQEQVSDILPHSNMNGTAKAPAGAFRGLSAYGTYDMAGNVKEWAWNEVGGDRYILGGAWNEPGYLFRHLIADDPWTREATHGFRCTTYIEPPDPQLLEPVAPLHEYPRPEPVSDDAFEILRGMYAYDRLPLEPRVEMRNDSLTDYRHEVVSIRAAYGGERMDVHLLIPHDVAPPYQSVIWFPGDDVFLSRSSASFASAWLFDFLPRAGRVLVYPVYKGMYERFESWERTPIGRRDMTIRWAQDISRTVDYLETRDDMDAARIAFYGFSGGAVAGPLYTAVEPRIATAILLGGGLVLLPLRPEADPYHFAPRTRTPTLMINGRDDFIMPHEASQRPLIELIGAPAASKRLARLDGGHIPSNRYDIIREVIDWLDRQFGAVRPAS